jgi:phosphatidylserine/phosphatidylglycerophosphate/cardiolipin synthase-like enzyme
MLLAGGAQATPLEICFSPDENCAEKLQSFFASAQKTIDVAIYDINLDEVVHQILVKSKTTRVRVIVDKKQAKGSHSAVPLLLKSGVDVRYGHQRGIMHDKFTIIDGARVETGSFNYTHHASQANQENQIYLNEPSAVSRFAQRFEKMWHEARPIRFESDRGLASKPQYKK